MSKRSKGLLLALPLVAVGALSACGGDDDGGSSGASGGEGVLSGVCPETISIQTDWFPESEHGALYEMVGDDYTVDTEKKIVSGTLIDSEGKDTGVTIEVRTGGPAIGFQPVSATMAADDSIVMGYAATDDQAFSNDEIPLLSVVAPLEINPQIIMWDPETYPNVKSIADLGKEGVTMNVFAGGTYLEVFKAEGVVSEDQIDPSYDGSPTRFISEGGKIAQQGFASAEPWQYKNEFAEWGKDVAFELIHDAGFEIYAAALAIRQADKDELSDCLKLFVPIVQQAAIDFINDPARTNKIIIDAVEKYADFWVYGEGVAAYSVETQKKLGLVGNGPDKTLGNFDFDRANKVLQQMKDAGLDVAADLKAEDIYTNEFINPDIGL
ncbi:MAG: nitrate ABC transporter substrate-binding protein [Acidimicrobiales bacterium mtb01]|nr:ABC transporter substrate-binding protein [Actinomycetota bacterium]TEX45115.1 MAG: nitrate ABC transporter substrate-binding protein [Acidimicrobiales bacterium mtb01]